MVTISSSIPRLTGIDFTIFPSLTPKKSRINRGGLTVRNIFGSPGFPENANSTDTRPSTNVPYWISSRIGLAACAKAPHKKKTAIDQQTKYFRVAFTKSNPSGFLLFTRGITCLLPATQSTAAPGKVKVSSFCCQRPLIPSFTSLITIVPVPSSMAPT